MIKPDIPPEPPLRTRLTYPDLEHHATALGYICFVYSQLELSLNLLIEQLVPCSPEMRRAIVDATGASITTRVKLAQKLASLKLSDTQNQHLDVALNAIVATIAPLRNRLVHDVWGLNGPGTAPVQLDQRSDLRSAQSYQRKTIPPPDA